MAQTSLSPNDDFAPYEGLEASSRVTMSEPLSDASLLGSVDTEHMEMSPEAVQQSIPTTATANSDNASSENANSAMADDIGLSVKAIQGEISEEATGNVLDRPDPSLYEVDIRCLGGSTQNLKAFVRMLSGPSVNVLVGPDRVSFTVPMSLLFNHSDYAQKALNGPFREASGNIIRLLDTEPEVFSRFVIYMHQHKLLISSFSTWTSPYEELIADCLLLWRFYVLADFLQSRYWSDIEEKVFRNLDSAIAYARMKKWETPILPMIALEVLRVTTPGCRLRQLVYWALRKEFSKSPDSSRRRPMKAYAQCMQEFLEEFLDEILEKIPKESSWDELYSDT